jgi:hypothetical protein
VSLDGFLSPLTGMEDLWNDANPRIEHPRSIELKVEIRHADVELGFGPSLNHGNVFPR